MMDLEDLSKQAFTETVYPNKNFPPSYYYRFLKLLAIHKKPRLSVELGTAGGGGALHLAWGWPPGVVVGLDSTWDHQENMIYLIKNFPNFHFIQGDSIKMAEKIYSLFGPIDILFIDTIHTYERTLEEFNAYQPYLSDDYIICLDDLKREGMEKALEDLPGKKFRLDLLHPPVVAPGQEYGDGGFAVITRPSVHQIFFDQHAKRFTIIDA